MERSMSRTSVDSCKQAPGVIAPVVSLKRCEGKGDCVEVCPENVFRVQHIERKDYRDLNAFHRFKLRVHGMQVAYTPNADACRSCGLCVSACPEKAITLRLRGTEL
jgi:NAD-dependent dihydropyrimidine dehydrogenase PreA subunit